MSLCFFYCVPNLVVAFQNEKDNVLPNLLDSCLSLFCNTELFVFVDRSLNCSHVIDHSKVATYFTNFLPMLVTLLNSQNRPEIEHFFTKWKSSSFCPLQTSPHRSRSRGIAHRPQTHPAVAVGSQRPRHLQQSSSGETNVFLLTTHLITTVTVEWFQFRIYLDLSLSNKAITSSMT